MERTDSQPESFSHRLRRRFSRESKPSSENHDASKLGFPFNLRAIKSLQKSGAKPGQDLTTLGNLGSSLLSERAYDSDAQFIPSLSRARNISRSPSGRPTRRMELSDLIERSHEREASNQRWALDQTQNTSTSHISSSDKQYISTPTASAESVQGQSNPLKAIQHPWGHHLAPFQTKAALDDMNIKSARSLPDLTIAGHQSIHSLPGTPATIAIPKSNGNPKPLADWKEYYRIGHQRYGPPSSDTLPGHPGDILVKKSRQPSASAGSLAENRPIHLEELGIPHRLASQTTASGSMSCNPSTTRFILPNEHGFFISPSQENTHPSQRSRVSAYGVESLDVPTRDRNFSSFYSPQSHSISSNRSPMQSSRSVNNIPIGKSRTKQATGDEKNLQSDNCHETGTLQSRFREYCGSTVEQTYPNSTTNDSDKSYPPRRVSIGWMSGGRRTGYGYSPVPSKDEEMSTQGVETYYPSRKLDSELNVKVPSDELNIKNPDKRLKRSDEESHFVDLQIHLESPPEAVEGFAPDMSPITAGTCSNDNRANPLSVFMPKSKDSHSMREYPRPPYMLGTRAYEPHSSPSGQIDHKGFRSRRAPELPPMTQIEHCQVPRSSQYSNQANNSLSRRWSRISLRGKQAAIVSGDNADDDNSEFFDLNDHGHVQESCSLQPSKSRSDKWIRRFTRIKESRRVSNIHQQGSSQTSSDLYEDCESDIFPSATMAEDLASVYQDCVKMPGSFDGSRWASRKSRMLWDACTEGLWHSA